MSLILEGIESEMGVILWTYLVEDSICLFQVGSEQRKKRRCKGGIPVDKEQYWWVIWCEKVIERLSSLIKSQLHQNDVHIDAYRTSLIFRDGLVRGNLFQTCFFQGCPWKGIRIRLSHSRRKWGWWDRHFMIGVRFISVAEFGVLKKFRYCKRKKVRVNSTGKKLFIHS